MTCFTRYVFPTGSLSLFTCWQFLLVFINVAIVALFLYQTYLAKFPPEPEEEDKSPPEESESSALPTFGTQDEGENVPTVQGAGVVANGDLADPSFEQRERSPEEVAQRDALIADLFSRYGEPILARTAKRLDARCCELKHSVASPRC